MSAEKGTKDAFPHETVVSLCVKEQIAKVCRAKMFRKITSAEEFPWKVKEDRKFQ